jgi:hypothetical protein
VSDSRRFINDVEEFVRLTGVRLDTVLKKVAFDAFANCLRRSPVDQGRFRGNWRIAISSPDRTTDDGARAGGARKGEPLRQAEDAAGKAGALGARWGQTVLITNSLPYALRLENGWSGQAPQGVVRLAVQDTLADFAKSLASVRSQA